ncbi:MAG: FHA domain-containing protein, partial [Planctomycetota bacterium]
MATLKLSKKVKGKIRGKSQQFQGETFGLGAGQENEIQIESDLVSEQHAQIQFENGKFYLLDLKSLLGTYKNGALVQDKIELQTNDKISIADRLFSVEINQEKELIHLIQESSHKKEKTPPELEELPEDKRWNKALLAICVLFGILTPALVLPAILPAEDIWSTGPLHFKHLVNGKPIDCSACHSQSFGKVPDQACAKCHKQESIRDIHHTQTKQQPLPCTQCHLEHQGRTSLPAFQHTTAENKIVDLTLTTPSLTSCRNCHPKVHKESAKPLVHLEIIEKTKVFKFPGFSHQQHLSEKATQKMKRKILCKDCHPYSPNPFEDFTPTQFETCLQCHYHKQKHSVPNHGETSCLQCHTSTYSGDWRKLKLTYQTLSSFQMKHSFHLAMGKGKTKKCQECHIAQKTLPTLIQGRRFPHEKHLQITPASKELCLACHYAPPKKIFTLRTPSALKSKHIPFSIRDEFQSNRFPLAPDAVKIKISPQKWLIRSGQKEFTIVQEDQKFQVYLRSLIVRMPNKELCQKCHNSPLTEKHSQMPWHQAEIQLRFTTKQRPATPFPHTP